MGTEVGRWVRIALVVLAVPQLVTGMWAVLAPEHWFDNFPGFDPRLVAADPPFNSHLATDAGAAFLATGVALVVAAALGHRSGVVVALAAYLAFAVPHFIFHVTHPADRLTTGENVANSILLGAGVVVALVLLWATVRRGRPIDDMEQQGTSRLGVG